MVLSAQFFDYISEIQEFRHFFSRNGGSRYFWRVNPWTSALMEADRPTALIVSKLRGSFEFNCNIGNDSLIEGSQYSIRLKLNETLR